MNLSPPPPPPPIKTLWQHSWYHLKITINPVTLVDPAASFRGGGNLGRGPNLGYPQNWKLHGFNPLFFGMDPNSLSKKMGAFGGGANDMMSPFLGFGGGAWPGCPPPLDPPVTAHGRGTNAQHGAQSSQSPHIGTRTQHNQPKRTENNTENNQAPAASIMRQQPTHRKERKRKWNFRG